MQEQLVIFGASGGGIRVARSILSLGIDFAFFVDNDRKKWGQLLEGKYIYSPEKLLERRDIYRVIIASEYQKEIEEQLETMGLASCRVDKETYLITYFKQHLSDFGYISDKTNIISGERMILIDLLEGVKLGGIETWSFTVARGLIEHGSKVKILSTDTDEAPPTDLTDIMINTNASYEDYSGTIKRLVDIMVANLPCAVIINKQTQALYAAYIVKRYYPNHIKLISVIHNDNIAYYRRQNALIDYVDAVACVSIDIRERFIKEFGLDEAKIFYKESAVDYDPFFIKEFSLDKTKPICIGFAARIEKIQKRADLLLHLIQGLEERNINYCLSIAGIGSYYPVIEKYVIEKQLQDRVHLLGQVSRNNMNAFWKAQDIFISLSDYEGVGLSMLEAMSYGVVPIETRVAGAEEFITPGKNGYICDRGDVAQMLQYIENLDQNRELLREFGLLCRERIRTKCNRQDYINYIIILAN